MGERVHERNNFAILDFIFVHYARGRIAPMEHSPHLFIIVTKRLLLTEHLELFKEKNISDGFSCTQFCRIPSTFK